MSGLDALFYLEQRQFVNRVRELLRAPLRGLAYVLLFVYLIVVGIFRAHRQSVFGLQAIPEPYASAFVFAYVTLLGIMAYGAVSGIVGAFSSSADARFLCGSKIPERLVVLWLQLRRCSVSVIRMLLTLVLYMVVSRSGSLLGLGLPVIGGTIVAVAIAIPMLKLRTMIGTRTAHGVAGAGAAAGILPMVILLSSRVLVPPHSAAAQAIVGFGAGRYLNALWVSNPLALTVLLAFATVAVALSYACGHDLYPDLYAASLKAIAFRERRKRGGTAAFTIQHDYRNTQARAHPFVDALRGPWTIFWKEWIAFARSTSMQQLFFFGLIACAVVGAILGHVAAQSKNPLAQTLGFASVVANLTVIFIAMGSAIGLATDLRKPLWWMGGDPLWSRLLAWVVATAWRLAACLAVGIAAWAIFMRQPIVAFAGIPMAITTVLYLRAIGLALYALFPSTIDQRGPLAMVRALLTYMLAAPPAIAGIVVGVVFHAIAGGLAVGVLCSVSETLLLVAFASWRIAGQGAAYAQAEGA